MGVSKVPGSFGDFEGEFAFDAEAPDATTTGPVSVEATGTRHPGLYDNPITMSVTWEFKIPDWTLRWDQPGTPKGGRYGAFFVGEKDTLAFWDNFATEHKAMADIVVHADGTIETPA